MFVWSVVLTDLFPSSLRGGERQGLRVQLSNLVDLLLERLLFFWLQRWIGFLLQRILLSAEGRQKFFRDSFSQCDHSCQWKRNEQLNLVIGRFLPSLGPELAPFQSLFA